MERVFTIKTEVFDGPLDLLLQLVEKRKLFINDISLAEVTEEYVRHIQSFETFPIKDTANFLIVASTLLLIKSRSLLPTIVLTEEEETSIEDLERRLRIYQKIKESSTIIKERFGVRVMREARDRNLEPLFAPGKNISVQGMHEAVLRVIAGLPKPVSIPQAVVKKIISLEEVMRSLVKRLTQGFKVSFKEFSAKRNEKNYIVVTFLAVLELIKSGIISVQQENPFSDITLEGKEPGVPDYSQLA